MPGPYLASEMSVFPTILNLNEGVVIHTGKLAQLAQTLRAEAASRPLTASPGTRARWQARVSQVQNELLSFWSHHYPEYLGPDPTEAAYNLPHRARFIFEQVSLLTHGFTP